MAGESDHHIHGTAGPSITEIVEGAGAHGITPGAGATARAASRVLIEAGAKAVWVAALARARRIDHSFDRAAHFDRTAAEHPIPIELVPDFRHQRATMNADNQPSI